MNKKIRMITALKWAVVVGVPLVIVAAVVIACGVFAIDPIVSFVSGYVAGHLAGLVGLILHDKMIRSHRKW